MTFGSRMVGWMSLQIWVDKYGMFVWLSELRMMEKCIVQLQWTQLSCNFCGKNTFFTQLDLRRHLFMLHNVAQCRQKGCHRLLNDLLSRNVHEQLQHPEMTSGCACVCVHVCLCACGLQNYFVNCVYLIDLCSMQASMFASQKLAHVILTFSATFKET